VIVPQAVVLAAQDEEAAPFLTRADEVGPMTMVGGARHRSVRLAGLDVLVVTCGIGLANAAAATAVALVGRAPVPVLAAGSAGGLGAGVRVGDVVVGTRHVYTGADARAFGYVLGQVPGMPVAFDSDPALVTAALAGPPAALRLLTGTVTSGDVFVDGSRADQVRADFPDALSTDMESTAVAQTAAAFGAPFVSVRGISDLCGPVTGYAEHVDDAADRSASVVVALLRQLAGAPVRR